MPSLLSDDFRVVAVGRSSDDLRACQSMILALPPETGFVLVLHLRPEDETTISRHVGGGDDPMSRDAVDGQHLVPSDVYLVPPGRPFAVSRKSLLLGLQGRLKTARAPPTVSPLAITAGRAVRLGRGTNGVVLFLSVGDRCQVAETLVDAGYQVISLNDGDDALHLVRGGVVTPDLVVADASAVSDTWAQAFAAEVHAAMRRVIPTLLLSDDVRPGEMRPTPRPACVRIGRGPSPPELLAVIDHLQQGGSSSVHAGSGVAAGSVARGGTVVYTVGVDQVSLKEIETAFRSGGIGVIGLDAGEVLLRAGTIERGACLIVGGDASTLDPIVLIYQLRHVAPHLPAIFLVSANDMHLAVCATRAGAADVLERHVSPNLLLARVLVALRRQAVSEAENSPAVGVRPLDSLTPRQHEILAHVVAGTRSKAIAAVLGISQRTVENHRAAIMTKLGASSLPALVTLVLSMREAGHFVSPLRVTRDTRLRAQNAHQADPFRT